MSIDARSRTRSPRGVGAVTTAALLSDRGRDDRAPTGARNQRLRALRLRLVDRPLERVEAREPLPRREADVLRPRVLVDRLRVPVPLEEPLPRVDEDARVPVLPRRVVLRDESAAERERLDVPLRLAVRDRPLEDFARPVERERLDAFLRVP